MAFGKPHFPLYRRLAPWLAIWLVLFGLHCWLSQAPDPHKKLTKVQQTIQSYLETEFQALSQLTPQDSLRWDSPGNRILIHHKQGVKSYLHPQTYLGLQDLKHLQDSPAIQQSGDQLLFTSTQVVDSSQYFLWIIPIGRKLSGGGWELLAAPHRIPNLLIQHKENSYPLFAPSGQPLIYLGQNGPLPRSKGWQMVHFGLVIGLLIIGIYLLQRLGIWAIKKTNIYACLGLILLGLLGLRFLTAFPAAPTTLSHWPVLHQIFTLQILRQSLGDLLINALILMWAMVFIHRIFSIQTSISWPRAIKLLFTTSNYLLILAAFFLLIRMIQYLVTEEQLVFDLENVFAWGPTTICALLVMILVFLAFFLLSHRAALSILSLQVSLPERLLGMGITMFCGAILALTSAIPLPTWQVLLLATSLILVMDLFVNSQTPNLTWYFGWLIILSTYASILLYQLSALPDEWVQEQIVPRLTQEPDSILIKELPPPPFSKEHQVGIPQLVESDYILAHYSWQEVDSSYQVEGQGYSWYSWQTGPGKTVVLRPRSPSNTQFERQFLGQNFRHTPHLTRFFWAIYQDQTLVYANAPEQFPRTLPQKRSALRIWSGSNERKVVLYRPDPNLLKYISLFSYLFSLFLGVSLLSALINSKARMLPVSLEFTLAQRPSLSNRIQIWLVGLILLSFLVIGGFSIMNFEVSARIAEEKNVARKLDALEANLAAQGGAALLNREGLTELGAIHQTPIFQYLENGVFSQGTDPFLARRSFLPTLLPNELVYQLQQSPEQIAVTNYQVKDLAYRLALRRVGFQNGQPILLGIPFGKQKGILRPSTADFLGTLLNAFVFSLLLAGAIAILVARSITHPLVNLGERLRSLSLEQNEPLHWDRKDEIGELIAEYNRMLSKLAESTRQLAKSERESAWREMAKQVAHEIKNPLTPMKLSIQHLEYAIRSNPDNVEELVKRTANRLVAQIDALTKIATEFSSFAKMPTAVNEHFRLDQLVETVHALFEKEAQQMEFALYIHYPDPQQPPAMLVYADRNQLLRVLNNLYKNAIQAIPEDRVGRIRTDVVVANQDWVKIAVADNGTGIPPEQQNKVFVPNFTTKTSGTGLGLAMSKNIVESAKGQIYFETKVGEGTIFYLELPLVREE